MLAQRVDETRQRKRGNASRAPSFSRVPTVLYHRDFRRIRYCTHPCRLLGVLLDSANRTNIQVGDPTSTQSDSLEILLNQSWSGGFDRYWVRAPLDDRLRRQRDDSIADGHDDCTAALRQYNVHNTHRQVILCSSCLRLRMMGVKPRHRSIALRFPGWSFIRNVFVGRFVPQDCTGREDHGSLQVCRVSITNA